MKNKNPIEFLSLGIILVPLLIVSLLACKNKSSIANNPIKKDTIKNLPKQKINPKIIEPDSLQSTILAGAKKIVFRNQKFEAFVVDLTKMELNFNSKYDSTHYISTINNLKKYYKKKNKKVIFATNGGMFHPNLEPVGLYVENEKEKFTLNLDNGRGNFFLKPNGVFYINKWDKAGLIESSKYPPIIGKTKFATQSGPMLLLNGEVNKQLGKNSTNKNIRSGVGLIDKNTIVFIISREKVNFYDFAMLFKTNFYCKNALYLDGFISEMYIADKKTPKTKNQFSILISVTQKMKSN